VNELLSAAVGAIVTALIAYPLGRVQGKQQTVFEEQAKVMVELRKRLLAADEALFFAATFADEENTRDQDELGDKILALGDYHEEKRVWLDERLNAKVDRIVGGYDGQSRALVTGRHGIPPPPQLRGMDAEEVYEEVRKWYWDEGQALAEDLEAEARKLLGVDPPWWRVWR
jgi:hypothetical protein